MFIFFIDWVLANLNYFTAKLLYLVAVKAKN